jgi:SAM-dependent methyltransferase
MDCRICGKTSQMKRYPAGVVSYVRCAACGGVFMDPYPLREDNQSFTGGEAARRYEREDLSRISYFQDRINRLERYLNWEFAGFRLLEVGCGSGVLLDEATRRGWRADGVELSPDLAQLAQARNPDSRVTVGDIQEQGFRDANYDAVIALDVLEHVVSPTRMMQICREALRPGGLLLLQTPNTHSLRFRAQGAGWDMLMPDQHLTLFSPQGLDGLLGSHGFDTLEMRTVSGTGLERGLGHTVAGIKEFLLDMGKLGNALCAVARAV